MTELQEFLTRRLRALPEVRLAYIFGSRATGRARAESDTDVAVLVDGDAPLDAGDVNRWLRRLASKLAGDGLRADELDIVLLNNAPPLLRHRILRDGLLLYTRNETERVRFAIRTFREYQDIEPRLKEHTKRRLKRLREGTRHGGCGDILAAARSVGHLLDSGSGSR